MYSGKWFITINCVDVIVDGLLLTLCFYNRMLVNILKLFLPNICISLFFCHKSMGEVDILMSCFIIKCTKKMGEESQAKCISFTLMGKAISNNNN